MLDKMLVHAKKTGPQKEKQDEKKKALPSKKESKRKMRLAGKYGKRRRPCSSGFSERPGGGDMEPAAEEDKS